jgi:hypothetical protein
MSTLKKEVAFIDANVADLDQLIAGLRSEVEPIVLTAGRSAAEQMAQALEGVSGLGAVHIVAHGRPGELQFSGGALCQTTLAQHADELFALGLALADDGVVQLYSCNVAAGEPGQRFVNQLADFIGADVFASADKVGAAALGGHWELNATSGDHRMPHDIPLQTDAADAYRHVLTITSFGLSELSDTGDLGDGITKIAAPTAIAVSGYSNQSTVTVFIDTNGDGIPTLGEQQVTVAPSPFSTPPGSFTANFTLGEGSHTIKAIDLNGVVLTTVVIDTTLPFVTAFDSSTPDGSYNAGDSISVTAQLNEAVQAGSNFVVTLNTGDTVTLTAAANGTTLTGTYFIGAGDNVSDLSITSYTAGAVTDLAGNSMTGITLPAGQNLGDNSNIVVDTTAPGAPTITSITENAANGINAVEAADGTQVAVDLTGTYAVAGDTVTITWHNEAVDYTLTADDITAQTTTVLIDAPTIANEGNGTFDVTAKITDLAGNSSGNSAAFGVTVDTVANAPTINVVASNDVVNDSEAAAGFAITGTGEVGATVTLTFSSSITLTNGNTAVVGGGGTWTIAVTDADVTAMSEGGETVTATQTDLAGNTSTSATRPITVDTGVPAAPTINDVAINNIVNDGEAAAGFAITGTGEAGAAVTLTFSSGITLATGNTAVVSAGGTWSVAVTDTDITAINEGAESITATQTDAAGNTSTSATHNISVDTGVPAAPVINAVAINDIVNDAEATAGFNITGTGETGATVTLTFSSGTTLTGNNTALVDGNGDWSIAVTDVDVTAMSEGGETITATQTDAAGNTSTSATRNITVDTIVDDAPPASLVVGGSSGPNVANNLVSFVISGLDDYATADVVFTAGANSLTVTGLVNGTYTADIHTWSGAIFSSLNITDAAGNSG